jgi:hypothetical protein
MGPPKASEIERQVAFCDLSRSTSIDQSRRSARFRDTRVGVISARQGKNG